MIKILVCEDERDLNRFVCLSLRNAGYEATAAYNGQEALDKMESERFDLVLTDIMMPVLDGFELCESIRSFEKSMPIIFMTAKDDKISKLTGYSLGIDDYVVKPFDTKEIVARIKAVLRRSASSAAEEVKEVHYDKLSINLTNYELKVAGVQIDTPPKEMELIFHLAKNPNRVFTRDQLLDEVWGYDYYGDSRTVDVHVKRLREKLEGTSDKWELRTVWGVGYKFETKE